MNKRTFFLKNKTIALATLIAFVSSCLPFYAHAEQTIAPNLMVIFGNSYSMNRGLDDVSYPAVTPLHFNDTSLGGVGTPYPYPLYGDQPSSKLYIAKQALSTVLNSNVSDNINLGFATFRQTFGMVASASVLTTRGSWPLAIARDSTMLTGTSTTQQKTDYGADPKNFKYVDWYRIWVGGSQNRNALLGKSTGDYNKKVVDDTKTIYMTGLSNGLPTTIVYQPGNTLAYDLDPVTGTAINSPTTTVHDQTYHDKATVTGYGPKAVFYGTGATGNLQVVTAFNPLATWRLCNTYYNSQGNIFQGFYIADKDIIDAYPSLYSSYTTTFGEWDYAKFDSSGTAVTQEYSQYCPGNGSGFSWPFRETIKRISDTYKNDNSRVWFSGIANYYSGWSNVTPSAYGDLIGWSGETIYTETDAANTTGTTTASYPSGVANPNRSDRLLITAGRQQSSAQHMGIFLDLPAPGLGYDNGNNRSIVKNFMGLQQMSQSGLDYDPIAQTIAGGKGIAASTFAYDASQSPIYDSLAGALAYFTSYKSQDPFKNCRSNNILLFFDGKEDAHWNYVNGTQQFLKPADIAAQLKAIGVKTYVIILSNNTGDISAANAIATAGGTTAAYNATSAASLLNSFTAVFAGLTGAVKTTSAPAAPSQVGSGGKLYQASYTLAPVTGHLYAYGFNSSAYVNNTPVWDAASLMTATNRTSNLYSNSAVTASGGTLVNFNSLDDAAFAIGTSPTVAQVKSYTLDPSYNSGAYLAGRASGGFMGLYSDQTMAPMLLTPPANVALDSDTAFTTYKTDQASRKNSLLVQNDDGFLYSFDPDVGSLQWGWMPRELVSGLKNYAGFWKNSNMKGGAVIVDAPTGTSYATYVLGTAQSGALHYALKLKNDTSTPPSAVPDTVAWTNLVANATSPGYQAPVVTYISGAGYANYVTTVGTTSSLYIHKIAAGETAASAALPFTPSSELVLVDNSLTNAGAFYVGDTAGAVYKIPVGTDPATVIAGKTKIGDTYNNQPAKFIGFYKYKNVDYVWAVTATGVTVFVDNLGTWQKAWETHVGGSGVWDVTGTTYTADTSNVTIPTTGQRQWLPTGATLSASAAVVKGALLLPILIPDATEPCAAGSAYYYIYSIDKGDKPKVIFKLVNADGSKTKITGNIFAGLGAPMKAGVVRASTGNSAFILATANQSTPDATGAGGASGSAATIKNGVQSSTEATEPTGGNSALISWREITTN